MSNTQRKYSSDFTPLFLAAGEGLRLQAGIDELGVRARAATTDARSRFEAHVAAGGDFTQTPDDLARVAVGAFALDTDVARLKAQLSTREQGIDEMWGEAPLAVRVLPGRGRKLILGTFFASGPMGSRQQEFSSLPRQARDGAMVAALLGQNALVLRPLRGGRIDDRYIVAPILREDGTPNIEVSLREPGWRDGTGPRLPGRMFADTYDERRDEDLARLREMTKGL